jgi:glycosyltransferase involved in cell wall biosynthesis
VLEKMATGLPMVVSDVGGNAEAVLAGENGLVVPPGDAAAFERALLTLHGDPAARMRMARRSRQLVEEKFTLQHMCAEHARLYRSLVSD